MPPTIRPIEGSLRDAKPAVNRLSANTQELVALSHAFEPLSDAILSKFTVRITRMPKEVSAQVAVNAVISLRVVVSVYT